MVVINSIEIFPALLNSSCAWSSDLEDLTALYDSPYTGAITTRTATLDGFDENETHTVAFSRTTTSTINSYGYSPYPLSTYLIWVEEILQSRASDKPIIISITASTAETLHSLVTAIQDLRLKISDYPRVEERRSSRIAIELNTSCPNIPDAPPSGYNFISLIPMLQVLAQEFVRDPTLTLGLKLPPFVLKEQFHVVLTVLQGFAVNPTGYSPDGQVSPFAFLTCTNTLGNALLFDEQSVSSSETAGHYALPSVIGGLAGDSLHALSLGNVYTFSQLLHGPDTRFHILVNMKIIGVGGVTSKEAAARMRKAGADVVACATLFGKHGVKAFEILSI